MMAFRSMRAAREGELNMTRTLPALILTLATVASTACGVDKHSLQNDGGSHAATIGTAVKGEGNEVDATDAVATAQSVSSATIADDGSTLDASASAGANADAMFARLQARLGG